MRITLLFEPSADRAIPFATGPERYQRLADEVGRYAKAQVQVVMDVLRNAPAEGYVLFAGSGDLSRSLADCGSALATELAPRMILLDVSWQRALEQLEKHRLAGAVDSLRLSEWLARPSSSAGPFGLRYLAKPIGASCVPMPAFRSPRYCLLQSEWHRGMPQLLADYLTAYDRDQQPLSTVRWVTLARVIRQGFGAKLTQESCRENETIPATRVESVSIKRAIDSLRRARESAHITLSQIAERSGLDPEPFGLLEKSDYPRATLGLLRAYFLALEPSLGWTLAEATAPPSRWRQKPEEQAKTVKRTNQPFVDSVIGSTEPIGDLPETPTTSVEVPWIFVQSGMTLLGNRHIRYREFEGEFDNPSTRTRKEESHAGV